MTEKKTIKEKNQKRKMNLERGNLNLFIDLFWLKTIKAKRTSLFKFLIFPSLFLKNTFFYLIFSFIVTFIVFIMTKRFFSFIVPNNTYWVWYIITSFLVYGITIFKMSLQTRKEAKKKIEDFLSQLKVDNHK